MDKARRALNPYEFAIYLDKLSVQLSIARTGSTL